MSDIPMIDFERKAVLYSSDGKALVRTAGFTPPNRSMALQTTGTFPQLNTKMTGGKKSGGKKSGGRKGC